MFPDLPALSGRSVFTEMLVPLNVFPNWTLVAQLDPWRWYLAFATGGAGGLIVTTKPTDPTVIVAPGIAAPQFGLLEFKYKDQLSYVQAEWYALDTAGRGACTVITANMQDLEALQTQNQGANNVP